MRLGLSFLILLMSLAYPLRALAEPVIEFEPWQVLQYVKDSTKLKIGEVPVYSFEVWGPPTSMPDAKSDKFRLSSEGTKSEKSEVIAFGKLGKEGVLAGGANGRIVAVKLSKDRLPQAQIASLMVGKKERGWPGPSDPEGDAAQTIPPDEVSKITAPYHVAIICWPSRDGWPVTSSYPIESNSCHYHLVPWFGVDQYDERSPTILDAERPKLHTLSSWHLKRVKPSVQTMPTGEASGRLTLTQIEATTLDLAPFVSSSPAPECSDRPTSPCSDQRLGEAEAQDTFKRLNAWARALDLTTAVDLSNRTVTGRAEDDRAKEEWCILIDTASERLGCRVVLQKDPCGPAAQTRKVTP